MQRRCTSLLIRGKEWETLYFPHLTPPPWLLPREIKNYFILHIILILAQGKKNACCVARYALAEMVLIHTT